MKQIDKRKAFILLVCMTIGALSCDKNYSQNSPELSIEIAGQVTINSFYDLDAAKPLTYTRVFIRKGNPQNNLDSSDYFFSIVSDETGKYHFYNLEPGPYQIFTYTLLRSSPTFTALYSGVKNFNVSMIGQSIDLSATIDQSIQTGVAFRTTDKFSKPAGGAKIFLYSSQEIANVDNQFSGKGSNYNLITDSLGNAFISNPKPGDYYARGAIVFDEKTVFKDGVLFTVTSNNVQERSLKLQ